MCPLIVPEVNPDAAPPRTQASSPNPNLLQPPSRSWGSIRFIANSGLKLLFSLPRIKRVSEVAVEGMEELDNQIRAGAGGGESAPLHLPASHCLSTSSRMSTALRSGGYTKEEL